MLQNSFGFNETNQRLNSSSNFDKSFDVDSSVVYLPPELMAFFMTFNLVICGEVIGILGIIGNVINIVIFYKQGYHDSVNITLTALALSDIGSLITLQIVNIMANPWFLNLDLNIKAFDVAAVIAFYPHNYFIRVCGFITAFASFERCLCVVSPLSVKRIITTKVALITNIVIFVITSLNLFPAYYIVYLDWTFVPYFNKTLLSVVYRQNPYNVFEISYIITDLFVPYFTFFVIITSTVVIGIKLNSRALWRQGISSVTSTVSTKEKKVVLMLTTVSMVFIVCLIPQSATLTAVSFVPGLSFSGSNFNLAFLCYIIAFFTETISSSVNILVYYKMSGKYRVTFSETFFFKK